MKPRVAARGAKPLDPSVKRNREGEAAFSGERGEAPGPKRRVENRVKPRSAARGAKPLDPNVEWKNRVKPS